MSMPAVKLRSAPDPTRRVDKFLPVTVKAVDEERKVITFRGTTMTPDREGDIVVPEGGKFANYRANPVFLWAHDWRGERLPIGKSLSETIITGVGVDFDIQFDSKDPFAMEVFRKYKEGYLNAVSIGFMPLRWEYLEGSGDEWSRGIRYNEWEHLELSGVPIPANPEALQNAMRRFLSADGDGDGCRQLKEIMAAEWGIVPAQDALLNSPCVIPELAETPAPEVAELPFDWDPDTEIITIRRTGQQITLQLLEGLDIELIREAARLRVQARQLSKAMTDLGLTEAETIRLLRTPVPPTPQPRTITADVVAKHVADAVEERVKYLRGQSYTTTGKPPKRGG